VPERHKKKPVVAQAGCRFVALLLRKRLG
jgi:hypothetical protein